MRVFVTGATGFIGSYLVPELIHAGHQVVGLTRSDEGARRLRSLGAEAFRGDVNDLVRLHEAAAHADGVIHTAFNHDMSNLKQSSERDRLVIETLGKALAGSDGRLIVTSGTGLARRPAIAGPVTESDDPVSSAEFARAASEEAADALIAVGRNVMILRLSQVHDARRQGRITWHVHTAREKGYVAYVGEGKNRLAAVHVSDAVRLYRSALEEGAAGARYHAVAEEGVPLHDIADVLGAGLNVPVRSITPEEAPEYFGWMSELAQVDLSASSRKTRQQLAWNLTGPKSADRLAAHRL